MLTSSVTSPAWIAEYTVRMKAWSATKRSCDVAEQELPVRGRRRGGDAHEQALPTTSAPTGIEVPEGVIIPEGRRGCRRSTGRVRPMPPRAS